MQELRSRLLASEPLQGGRLRLLPGLAGGGVKREDVGIRGECYFKKLGKWSRDTSATFFIKDSGPFSAHYVNYLDCELDSVALTCLLPHTDFYVCVLVRENIAKKLFFKKKSTILRGGKGELPKNSPLKIVAPPRRGIEPRSPA